MKEMKTLGKKTGWTWEARKQKDQGESGTRVGRKEEREGRCNLTGLLETAIKRPLLGSVTNTTMSIFSSRL